MVPPTGTPNATKLPRTTKELTPPRNALTSVIQSKSPASSTPRSPWAWTKTRPSPPRTSRKCTKLPGTRPSRASCTRKRKRAFLLLSTRGASLTSNRDRTRSWKPNKRNNSGISQPRLTQCPGRRAINSGISRKRPIWKTKRQLSSKKKSFL